MPCKNRHEKNVPKHKKCSGTFSFIVREILIYLAPSHLPVEEAVRKLCYLVENALVRRLSGVDLKDDVPPGYLPFAETRALG